MFKRLYKLLFDPCDHKWCMKETYKIFDIHNVHKGNVYILQCEKCGKLKNHKFLV